jgi:hypothetical protein
MDCYIYFKAEAQHSEQIVTAERELQEWLRRTAQIRGQLQRRPEASHGILTWMETYRDVPENFAALLQQALSQSSLQSLACRERHAEYFMNVDVCV